MRNWLLGGVLSLFFSLIALPVMAQSQGILARFCDLDDPNPIDTTATTVSIASGATTGTLCVDLINNRDEQVTFHFNIVDAARQGENVVCQGEGDKQQVGQYVTGYDALVDVPASSHVRITPEVVVPSTALGRYAGCITYYDQDAYEATKRGDAAMNTFIRTAHTFQVHVDGNVSSELTVAAYDLSGRQLVTVPDGAVNVALQDGKLHVGFVLHNSGNVAQVFSGQIVVGWLGGTTEKFIVPARTIQPGEHEPIVEQFDATQFMEGIQIDSLQVEILYTPSKERLSADLVANNAMLFTPQRFRFSGLVRGISLQTSFLILIGIIAFVFLVRWIRFQWRMQRDIEKLRKRT